MGSLPPGQRPSPSNHGLRIDRSPSSRRRAKATNRAPSPSSSVQSHYAWRSGWFRKSACHESRSLADVALRRPVRDVRALETPACSVRDGGHEYDDPNDPAHYRALAVRSAFFLGHRLRATESAPHLFGTPLRIDFPCVAINAAIGAD